METVTRRVVSEEYVRQQLQKSGRRIKTAGNSQPDYSVLERVKMIIAKQLYLKTDDFGIFSRLVEDLGANFNDRVSIFNSLEREFGVKFGGTNIYTVGDIVNYIDSR